MSRWAVVLLAAAGVSVLCGCAQPTPTEPLGPPVAIRAEHLTVTPATGPVTHVLVRNLRNQPYEGAVIAKFPDAWKMNRTRQEVAIAPGQTARVPFAIEKGANAASNLYRVRVKAVGAGEEVSADQWIVCASAPYFKPKIDGRIDDWNDAIPVTFATGSKQTVVRTYWSRRSFSLLVAVEENALYPLPQTNAAAGFDAVQIAISPREAVTPTSDDKAAQRYELVLAAVAGPGGRMDAKCFALIRPGVKLAAAQQARPLAGLELADAEIAVVHKDGVTYYECSIPFQAIRAIRPDPGREFCFSVLVHDPDGTGLRDWGKAAGLWPSQRSRLAWCSWLGARWPAQPPFDNKIEWGFCSSRQ